MLRRVPLGAIELSCFILLINSCKDMGSELPTPARPVLVSTQSSVNLSPSGQATLTISGGNPPYTVSSDPDPALASVALNNLVNGTATLTITASASVVTPGTTSVKIKDTDGDAPAHQEQEITIIIIVNPVPISFSSQIQPIFTTNCTDAGCHPGGGAPFSLQAGASYGNLVGVAATNGPCAGDLRVQPSNASGSALIKRLNGTCGQRMPLGSPSLPLAQIQLISDWINQGANNN